jgi:hypothetical protein
MAFAEMSAAHKNTVCTIDKTIHDKDRVDSAGAHHSDNPDMGWILKTGHTGCIGGSIATPVAKEAQNPRFIFPISHLDYSACCQLSFAIQTTSVDH